MCGTCGCSQPGAPFKLKIPGENDQLSMASNHVHHHEHGHGHSHHHHEHSHDAHQHHQHHHHNEHHHKDISAKRVVDLEADILLQNNLLAQRNRGFFEAKNIHAINLVSSPGSGKTTLLERTIKELKDELQISVIEGDQQTTNDADRIKAAGAPVIQVNTGTGCHLDSEMIQKAVRQLQVQENSLLIIENVGNLVCPSLFDLGESERVVIISVTEGEDKPLKYPNMFETAQYCVINKIDLLPYVEFDVEKSKSYARRINPDLQFFEVSATKGTGMNEWYEHLRSLIPAKT